MLYNLAIIFMIFITCSFIGKIGEIIQYSYYNKKFMDRGFFIGPYIPIWGVGALILGPILINYKSQLIIVFLLGILIGGTIEYIVSYIQEKIYGARWWDYSNERINLNGRICLLSCIQFGVLSLIYVYLFYPYYTKFLISINHNTLMTISFILFIIFIIDMIISYVIINDLKNKRKLKSADCTEDVKREIRKMIFGR